METFGFIASLLNKEIELLLNLLSRFCPKKTFSKSILQIFIKSKHGHTTKDKSFLHKNFLQSNQLWKNLFLKMSEGKTFY